MRKRFGESALRGRKTERDHFKRQRETAKRLHLFRLVGDHHHALRRQGDNLFTQMGATAAFDKAERGIDLIGTVDRKIKLWRLVESGQRDAERCSLRTRRLRRRHADNVQFFCLHAFGKQIDEMLRRRSCPEAKLHAIAHERDGAGGGFAFERVEAHWSSPASIRYLISTNSSTP